MSGTLNELMIDRMGLSGDHPAARFWNGKEWITVTWSEYLWRAAEIGLGLEMSGLKRGEAVTILAPTGFDWASIDLGILIAGGVSIGLYPTLTADQAGYQLSHSETSYLFVFNQALYDRIRPALSGLNHLRQIIAIQPVSDPAESRLTTFEALLVKGANMNARDSSTWMHRANQARPDDLAVLVYTSGTTGNPKGAMLTHRNLRTYTDSITQVMPVTSTDHTVAFLPMAHVAERVVGHYGRLANGSSVTFARSLETLMEDIALATPDYFGAVPRIFEKIHTKFIENLESQPPGRQEIIRWALEVGRNYSRVIREGRKPGLVLNLKHRVAKTLVLSKLKEKLGGKVRFVISGAAPISPDLLEFFHAFDLLPLEVYGLTETTSICTANKPDAYRIGTVGKAIPGVEIRIAPDGEILVRSEIVFKGYFKEPGATSETIRDGWLHTGDIGEIDPDGYLRITDRKKNLIITAGGKNIAPAGIEGMLKSHPLIGQVLYHADRRKFPAAIFTLDPETSAAWAKVRNLSADLEALAVHPDLQKEISEHVNKINQSLAQYEQVKRWTVLTEDFTIDNGLLTSTMKVKRKEVENRYAGVLDAFYHGGD